MLTHLAKSGLFSVAVKNEHIDWSEDVTVTEVNVTDNRLYLKRVEINERQVDWAEIRNIRVCIFNTKGIMISGMEFNVKSNANAIPYISKLSSSDADSFHEILTYEFCFDVTKSKFLSHRELDKISKPAEQKKETVE